MADNFRTQILNNKEAAAIQTPVRTLGSVTFMYLRHNDLYVLMVTRNNANVMLAFKFMTSVRGARVCVCGGGRAAVGKSPGGVARARALAAAAGP